MTAGDRPWLYDPTGEFGRCPDCGSRKYAEKPCALCASPEGPAERAAVAEHRARYAAAMDERGAHQIELERHEAER